MGRTAKVRGSYTKDATALSRIRDAVEKDTARTEEWRLKAIEALEHAITQLLLANANKTDST